MVRLVRSLVPQITALMTGIVALTASAQVPMYGQPGWGMQPGMGMGMQHGMGMPGRGPTMGASPGPRAMLGLQLTSEQQEQIKAIMTDTHQKQTKLMQEILAERPNIEKLFSSRPLDADAISSAYDRVFDLRRQMIMNMIHAQNEADALITDEQRAKLAGTQGTKSAPAQAK